MISSRPHFKLLRALKSSEDMARRCHSRPCLSSCAFLQSSSFYRASIIGLNTYSGWSYTNIQVSISDGQWEQHLNMSFRRMNLNSLKITELIFLKSHVWNYVTIFLRYMGSFWKYNTHAFHFSFSGKSKENKQKITKPKEFTFQFSFRS